MSAVRPVIGPLWSPTSTSGITFPGCSHMAPDSCSRCDGTGDDVWEERRNHRVPSGRPMTAGEVHALLAACSGITHTDNEKEAA